MKKEPKKNENIMAYKAIQLSVGSNPNDTTAASLALYEISNYCIGMSGRVFFFYFFFLSFDRFSLFMMFILQALRKLPFLALTKSAKTQRVSLPQFLVYLHQAVQRELNDRYLFIYFLLFLF